MAIIKLNTKRTPRPDDGLTWEGGHIYVDRYPNYNIYIPRLVEGERIATTYMTGASPDIREAMKRAPVAYVADSGWYLEDLPENPTGKRVAFIHERIFPEDKIVKVVVRTGVDWEILVEEMNFMWYKKLNIVNLPLTAQMKVNFITSLPELHDRSNIYVTPIPYTSECTIHVTGGMDFVARDALNKVILQEHIDEAFTAYSNILQVESIQHMHLIARTLFRSSMFIVRDAYDQDPTVDSGMAIYNFNYATGLFTKVYESEGSDVVVSLNNIVDAPASAQMFDKLVMTKHEHNVNSLPVIDELSTSSDDYLVFNDMMLNPGLDMHIREW